MSDRLDRLGRRIPDRGPRLPTVRIPDLPGALCSQADPDLFSPEPGDTAGAAQAKKVCAQCPELAACLEWALQTREPHGIWGGMSEQERNAVLRSRRMPAA